MPLDVSTYLIPARGLKPGYRLDITIKIIGFHISNPRKGTETGGGLVCTHSTCLSSFHISNPRKGTETESMLYLPTAWHSVSTYLIPARGLKHLIRLKGLVI